MLLFLAGIVVGFLLATVGAVCLIKKKGYDDFDSIPNREDATWKK